MGVRLSVKLEGTDEWYGDDHKLYFYYKYENIQNSFAVLYHYMIDQWDPDKTEYDWIYNETNPQKEFYDFLSCLQGTDELIIPDCVFKIFCEEYLKELKNAGKGEELIKNVTEYLTNLSNQPGNKVLEWG